MQGMVIFLFASTVLFYIVLLNIFSPTLKGRCNCYTPTRNYCVETHFKDAQELCSSVFNCALDRAKNGSNSTRSSQIRKKNPWWSCPEPGKGRQSVILGAIVDGRLGNTVWSYLSVVVTAEMYGFRPVIYNSSTAFMAMHAFDIDYIRMPTIEWMEQECNMSGWLDNAVQNENLSTTLSSRKDLYRALEKPPKAGLEVYRYDAFVTTTELLVPRFHELQKELVLHKDKTITAQKYLHDIKKSHTHKLDKQSIEFVGIHVRRTDYLRHMKAVFQFGKVATPKFFHAAMDWFIKTSNVSLAFVVVSDDRNWTKARIIAGRNDVYLAGDGDISNPGIDLAILAACNHTIFAYGTFGLTAALLANRPGGFTVIFDPENGTITKEMEFASNLPGWRIMTEDGNITYRENRISYEFFGHPPVDANKNAR